MGNVLVECLFESALTIWCSSLQEDARAIPSVLDLHFAVSQVLKPCALSVCTSP